ncbi:MAG: phosphate transport system regulatory protein PhoU [Candidatus Thermofonsia Clade 3 bacterium]|jgi:phosphate transport system protein|uniref:Phosphate-specific transport system accessory protein PhoU n=1 Tax=Candidatus Thermofonsia Clade 3 bacterium TaxID=2364212 RepID=A0A2M8QAY7_9CHLR|nr:phosphate signaling complex protein PhoU [Candidatus Roseilinea sp. NK_OTU-006]PJF46968.1 MAG: phosphate transport system regulatory protein PhoU [Candidatus Thermofonsia Clade 3 bacterium]
MRSILEGELQSVRDGIAALSAQAIDATARAVDALIHRNFDEARGVKRDDKAMDVLRYEVERACLAVMATQQPVARDLRELIAASIVAVELERCGDYAKGVAKAARRIARCDSGIPTFNLADMDRLARDMLGRSTRAFLEGDVQAARQVLADDDRLDQMYNALLSQAMDVMANHPQHIECGTWLLHAGHNLERIGDRATNIAERVIFVATGDITGDLNVHDPGQVRSLQ